MKQTIAAVAFGFTFLLTGAAFAAQHEMPKGDKPAQGQKAETKKPQKKCPAGQVYNKKDKKCVAKPEKRATPATPATPAAPAAPAAPAQ